MDIWSEFDDSSPAERADDWTHGTYRSNESLYRIINKLRDHVDKLDKEFATWIRDRKDKQECCCSQPKDYAEEDDLK
jgi:hypothetical protein